MEEAEEIEMIVEESKLEERRIRPSVARKKAASKDQAKRQMLRACSEGNESVAISLVKWILILTESLVASTLFLVS